MKKQTLIFMASMALALAAKAGSISYSDTFTEPVDFNHALSFTQFNPDLGTLTSIDISLGATFSSAFTITNTGASTYGSGSFAEKSLQVFLGGSAVDQAVDANNPNGAGSSWLGVINSSSLGLNGLAPGAFKSGTKTGSGDPLDASYTVSTLLADFTGTGTTPVDFYSSSGFLMNLVNGSSYDSSSTTTATLTGVITYYYTPAPVPEPSTMALSALGGLGLWLLARRK